MKLLFVYKFVRTSRRKADHLLLSTTMRRHSALHSRVCLKSSVPPQLMKIMFLSSCSAQSALLTNPCSSRYLLAVPAKNPAVNLPMSTTVRNDSHLIVFELTVKNVFYLFVAADGEDGIVNAIVIQDTLSSTATLLIIVPTPSLASNIGELVSSHRF